MNKELQTTLRQTFGILIIIILLLISTICILTKKINEFEHSQFIPQFTQQQMQQICIEEEIY